MFDLCVLKEATERMNCKQSFVFLMKGTGGCLLVTFFGVERLDRSELVLCLDVGLLGT